jgi:uncharacterized protein (TIGR02246 family)
MAGSVADSFAEVDMRLSRIVIALCSIALLSTAAFAQDSAAITQVLRNQQAAWNRGDIAVFMEGYKNSPDTTFVGKTIQHGYQSILERYKRGFATREAMGTLDFSDLSVRMLGANYAVATGHYHLARSAAGGGDATGIFSLVFEREPEGWRVILDHSSPS